MTGKQFVQCPDRTGFDAVAGDAVALKAVRIADGKPVVACHNGLSGGDALRRSPRQIAARSAESVRVGHILTHWSI